LKNRIIIRKRERSDLIYFVKKGEIKVVFPTEMEDQPEQSTQILFTTINKGGYFNLSNAILKKFSLFEFIVASESAELYILNAADLALMSKTNQELYLALKSHAILYQVDGTKYDFERFSKKSVKSKQEKSLNIRKNMWRFFMNLNRNELESLVVFRLVDDLYNLRRKRYIEYKKKVYEQEQIKKREESIKVQNVK
jgi:CRP-like cAMP-binding protein